MPTSNPSLIYYSHDDGNLFVASVEPLSTDEEIGLELYQAIQPAYVFMTIQRARLTKIERIDFLRIADKDSITKLVEHPHFSSLKFYSVEVVE